RGQRAQEARAIYDAGSSECRRSLNASQQPVAFVVRTRCEIERGRIAPGTVSEIERPQTGKYDRVPLPVTQGSHQCARGQVVRVNLAVSEVPHQQCAAEIAKGRGSDSQSPRRIQIAGGTQALQQIARQIVNRNVSVTR